MPRNSKHSTLAEAIKTFIEENHLQKGIDEIQVKEAWKAIMGKSVNKYTTAIQLKNDTLIVTLSSSVLREELSYGKTAIIKLINEALGRNVIKEIALR
jgi:Dna[CI] antecedent, DciA